MRKGFSLVELMVVMGLMALIGGSLYIFVHQTWVFNTYANDSLSSQQDVLKSLKTFAFEVRSAAQSNLGAYPIDQATTSTFAFYSDMNNDGIFEHIRYFLSGKTLKKGVIVPGGNPLVYSSASETIASAIAAIANTTSTPLFTYYDSNYDGTATATPLAQPVDVSTIRLIKLNVLIDRLSWAPPGPLNYTTQISIRNVKSNL